MTESETISVHATSWNNRELFHSILSRYCVVIEDLGGRSPTYLISEKKDQDIHEVLQGINNHLKKLGYSARLFPDEPWIIQLIPDPRYQWPSPRFVISMWLISLITTIYAAEKWMNSGRPDGGWFFENASLDAMMGYTIPIFLTLTIASFIQKKVAKNHGVHLPHLFPIPGPAMIWWPFGMIGFASLPRSDARLWPDRSALGNTGLSAPFVMVFSGMVLIFLGLILTPEIVALNSAPFVVELPFLANILAIISEGERLVFLKTTWAHPFTRAGITITFFGWIALLPIPTLPGGRILIARMGIPEARSGSSQVMLLLVVLLFAFLFGAFAEWNIWVPVVALCASLLITRGSDPTLPIVLDDFKGLPEKDHRRLGIILFMIFMFALPSQLPFSEDNNWNNDISYSISDDIVEIDEGWFNQSIIITNPSLITQSWSVGYHQGPFGGFNLSSVDCSSGKEISSQKCGGEIEPLSSITVEFNFQWLEPWNSAGFDLIWHTSEGFETNSVIPNLEIYPISNWIFNDDYDDPKACLDIFVDSKNNTISLSSPPEFSSWRGVDADNNYTVVKGVNELCLDGLSGDNMAWISGLQFSIDNHTFASGYERSHFLSIPQTGIILDSNESLFPFSIMGSNYNGTCEDIGVVTPPSTIVNNTTIWDMRVLQFAEYTNSNPILLLVESNTEVSVCSDEYLPQKYQILEGPEMLLMKDGNLSHDWIGDVMVENESIIINNPSDDDLTIDIEFDGNGEQWQISNTILIPSKSTENISAIAPETGVSFVWLELNEGDVILHLVNHEV